MEGNLDGLSQVDSSQNQSKRPTDYGEEQKTNTGNQRQ